MLDILSISDVGLVRKVNEDNCAVAETPNGILCVVCDGMGGHAGGATASRMAVDNIVQFLSKEKYSDARQALKESLDLDNITFQVDFNSTNGTFVNGSKIVGVAVAVIMNI